MNDFFTFPPNVNYVDYFTEFQKEARDAEKGLWGIAAGMVAPASDPAPITQGTFVGSVKSDKYYKLDYRHAKNILPENEIWFKTVKEALDAKYVPCGVCKPPQ